MRNKKLRFSESCHICCTDKARLIKLSLQSPQIPQALLLLLAGVWIQYSKTFSLFELLPLCVSRIVLICAVQSLCYLQGSAGAPLLTGPHNDRSGSTEPCLTPIYSLLSVFSHTEFPLHSLAEQNCF